MTQFAYLVDSHNRSSLHVSVQGQGPDVRGRLEGLAKGKSIPARAVRKYFIGSANQIRQQYRRGNSACLYFFTGVFLRGTTNPGGSCTVAPGGAAETLMISRCWA